MAQQYEIKLDTIKDTLVGNNGNVLGVGLLCTSALYTIASFKTLSIRYLDNVEPQDFESSILFIPTPYCIFICSSLFFR